MKLKLPSTITKPQPSSPDVKGDQGNKIPQSPGGHDFMSGAAKSGVVVTTQYPPQPESFVYSSGVERQFFDTIKEALTAYSRDELAWAEFLRCLDLYTQEFITRTEMLGMVHDLLGKRNAELFEEFKHILTAAGAPGAPAHDDSWHSVPLSEIDFVRCRKCSPSYRALPRDYPNPPCSERSEDECKVLNNVWVSLPVGSEESYTFRHMRKNQYEEVLFRCEDERFEIDMVVDSNAATLRRLEPIEEEISILQQKEDLSGNFVGNVEPSSKSQVSVGGLAGKIFKYSFDKHILQTIHRNSISRIYGDAGPEMLELLFKNPVVAVPVIVKRLRQKDKEFRMARDVLFERWKELTELNYYKSLDHRSLTWRTIDKRATSTRTLVAEIKDRAAHDGNEGESAMANKKEKAKEEHGSFYEATMGRYLSKKVNLTNLPKPTMSLFTPHLSVIYENNSWAQRDAYRILSFALERGSISPTDKERCHRVWRDFLCPFFSLGLMWMQSPAIAFAAHPQISAPSIVSDGDDSGNEEDDSSMEETDLVGDMEGDMMVTEEVMKDCKKERNESNSSETSLLDHQPLPPGALVSTVYGEGTILKYHRMDRIYVVTLKFGVGHLNANSVLCTVLPVEKSALTQQFMSSDKERLLQKDDMLFIGPQSLYLFFRLHHVLIRRLNIAREIAYCVNKDPSLRTLVERMPSENGVDMGLKRYDAYLSLVYGLVEGGYSSSSHGTSASAAEGGKYEDRVRCLLGHGSYELATMDKLVSHILKNLQNLANDDTLHSMIQVFRRHMESGTFKPLAMRQETALLSESENMFAFQYCKIPDSDKVIMHMEYLGCISENEEEDVGMVGENDLKNGMSLEVLNFFDAV